MRAAMDSAQNCAMPFAGVRTQGVAGGTWRPRGRCIQGTEERHRGAST